MHVFIAIKNVMPCAQTLVILGGAGAFLSAIVANLENNGFVCVPSFSDEASQAVLAAYNVKAKAIDEHITAKHGKGWPYTQILMHSELISRTTRLARLK